MKTRRLPDADAHRTRTEPELPTAPSVDPLVSTQLGEFLIEERIGAGGMGVVYRAVHPLIGKQAAVKVLRAELMSPEQEQRLLIEARTVNAIRHPGILDVFNFGRLPDGRPYIVMELLQGRALSDVLHAQGRLDVATTVRMLDQMLSALGAAHRAGVVHRDLKPANVFLVELPDAEPTLKLVDFGIAKVLQSREGLTLADGSVLGTPDFMAPEQIRGGTVGPATDLYALGVLAFQMLTGEKPFQGENVQVMFAHVEQPAPRASSRVKGLPPALDALVLQLMEKDPARRPASAEGVRQQLRGLSKTPAEASPPPGPTRHEGEAPTSPSTPRPALLTKLLAKRQNRVPLAAMGAVALGLLGTGLWALTRTPEAPPELARPLPMPPAPVVEPRPTSLPNPPSPQEPPEAVAPVPTTTAEALQDDTEARDEADPVPGTEAKSTGLPPLPLGSPSEKRMARRLSGLFKQLRARAKDVDAEGELRGRLVQQYRAAVDASEPERARIHLALDAWEKELTERIARHDAPPPTVVMPAIPKHPPLVLPPLPALPQGTTAQQRLAQRLDRLVAELRRRTQGQDVAPDLTRQLVKLYGFAAEAQTATQRMEVNRALDAWQDRLKARFSK
ncbi:protein kinase [Corallococcus sp. BB11-1]|uniref:serine/threonine-protein kinase n=1 Tax=Corallococcus sp. BB11-1 TaxID=2996783 RepID=UPI002270595D|nr:serine/threonine-protein kinase [Corallococcus sp. BB11-1]MCY1030897.1 protein kinase [Corallococcus sp. BB11-1]